VASACLDSASLGMVQGVSIGGGCCRHLDQHTVGAGRGCGCLGPPRRPLGVTGLGVEEVAAGVGQDCLEPVGDLAAWRRPWRCWRLPWR
jgi:hypothetical protein